MITSTDDVCLHGKHKYKIKTGLLKEYGRFRYWLACCLARFRGLATKCGQQGPRRRYNNIGINYFSTMTVYGVASYSFVVVIRS